MKNSNKVSIIIPVFNRAWCVARAVESAVCFVGNVADAEIVLIDDGSTDSSLEIIHKTVIKHCHSSNISFHVCTHDKNKGVCATKNTGARAATGTWLVFFDSDDELMPSGLSRLESCLAKEAGVLHFFTAIDEQTSFKADDFDSVEKRNFERYLINGIGGEALPVIKRDVFIKFQYDEDIRGYESLAYMRIVKNFGFLTLHSLGLRRYYTSNTDRLSTKLNMRKRRNDLVVGHLRALREHYKEAPLIWSAKQVARSIYTLVR